jgi:hypothetical protein
MNFFQLFLPASGRRPAAIVDRLNQAAIALFDRMSRRRPRCDGGVPAHYLSNNHLRRDIGLPPLDPCDWLN